MKKYKRILGMIFLCVLLMIVVGTVFGWELFPKKGVERDVVVKENVFVITEDMESFLTEVTGDALVFNKDVGCSEGDVLVAGISDVAPDGFIRKVISISEINGMFKYKTEYAVLTDVFEEAHIIKTFAVTKEEVRDIDDINNGVMSLKMISSGDVIAQSLGFGDLSNMNHQNMSSAKIKSSKNGLGIILELDEEIGNSLKVNGKVEVNTYLELKIDIEHGEIDFGMAVHTNTSGELFVGCQEELFDKDDKDDFNGEYEKELIKKSLPNIQFAIGPVPVVITNDFKLTTEISTQLEGQIGTTVGVNTERVSGFEYSSKSGTIREINEKKYLDKGMEWKTEAKASGELEAGVYAHLITKLYGSTGTDLSLGIAGSIEGELGLGVGENFSQPLYGNLKLSISPKVSGKIVVTVPIVDYNLVETEILKVSLPAFWEKEWAVPNPMLLAMKNGDFSAFAGNYIATPENQDVYGGGQKLNPLKLEKDGSISGGGSYYREKFYPTTKPIAVKENEDGTYKCTLDENSYYIIYPVGVMEENEYAIENQAYLRDVVYIRCFVYDYDGEGLDVTYYSDVIENIVVDYEGDDWISVNDITAKIGEKFISGTGIEYEVIGTEQNEESGRMRIIFKSKDDKKWMVTNLPAWEWDRRTGIWYYEIWEYKSSPNYKAD